EPEPKPMLGDINGNGKIEKYDYILVKRLVMSTIDLSGETLNFADVNKNGRVEKYDYILVKRHVMGTYVIEDPHST
ncbi:MAG: dockerin type I repeat-containing protein, partial [Clostridia bacterium]|nr:dockerin type I repeat-containing protein [Clostridia bacterium]